MRLVLAGLLLAWTVGSVRAADVEQWGLFELSLTGPAGGNPFVDVELSATFTQGDRSVTAAGFYDGDGVYRVRFMPPAPGEWNYTTKSNRPELAGKAMVAKTLTSESTSEQSTAGLTNCTPEEFARIQQLNADYNAKFGFPFILAVRGPRGTGLTRQQIIETDIDTRYAGCPVCHRDLTQPRPIR